MIEKFRGIVIKETPFGDSSKIISLYTKEKGIIGIMCKGAKSLKSKLRAVSARFTYGDFHMYYKEGKLSTLIAVDVIDDLYKIKTDITLLGYLAYITELVEQVYKQNDSNEIFDLFTKVITKMNKEINPLILTNILEIKLLDYLGIGLNLDACNICGDKTNIVTIDADIGGYVCSHCKTREKVVDQKIIKLIRMYYYVDIDSISKVDISDNVAWEINIFLDKYYERYTGLYLYSKDFLSKVR